MTTNQKETSTPASRRIQVSGKIEIGKSMRLNKSFKARSDEHASVEAQYRGPGISQGPIGDSRMEVQGLAASYDLTPSEDPPVTIENDGLVTSYGIFGAPGTGKTRLLMHLLRQLIAHESARPERRFGCLVLDPKASLRAEIREIAKLCHRENDVKIVGDGKETLNVLHCPLPPHELGAVLVLAGQSAGIGASEPFWFLEWKNVFISALAILTVYNRIRKAGFNGIDRVSIAGLLDAILEKVPAEKQWPAERKVLRLARELLESKRLTEDEKLDIKADVANLERFYRNERYVGTVEAFIIAAYGVFRRRENRCYSDESPSRDRLGIYGDIIEKGKIVLISPPPSEPAFAKTMCTLTKVLFQRTVLARFDLCTEKVMKNDVRPLLIACDEYSEIASEVPGQPAGDGQFLALARQYGCMALFATQSVNVLEASSLGDKWRSVFSNFAAQMFLRLADDKTAEEAEKLGGEREYRYITKSIDRSVEGKRVSETRDVRFETNLTRYFLTQVLKRRQVAVVGTLDGGDTPPGIYYAEVPNTAS